MYVNPSDDVRLSLENGTFKSEASGECPPAARQGCSIADSFWRTNVTTVNRPPWTRVSIFPAF